MYLSLSGGQRKRLEMGRMANFIYFSLFADPGVEFVLDGLLLFWWWCRGVEFILDGLFADLSKLDISQKLKQHIYILAQKVN
jgi:hypothetical protein